MNKDQIMRAVENASDEQLEQIAVIVEAAPTQVPVTQRHVGCVVEFSDSSSLWKTDRLIAIDPDDGFENAYGCWKQARFPKTYRVPITHRWSGGEQPVADDAIVLIQKLDGQYRAGNANNFRWNYLNERGDIIGYTVLDVIGVEDES